MKITCVAVTITLLLVFIPDAFSLTPMVDLSGKWSGSAKMQDVDGYCSFTGVVTATLKQNGDSLIGQYEFTITNSKSTGKLESMTCSSDSSARGSLVGKVDGTVVTMMDSEGIGISGTATNDLLILDFADSYVTGTVKLQKFADFSKSNLSKLQSSTIPQMIDSGMSHLNEKRFDKALESFNKIIGKEPNNIVGWMGKGVSYVGLKNYDQAITHFKKSLELSPNNKDALAWLGRAYYLQNDCQTASKYYFAALKVDPQNTKILAEQKIINSCLAKQIEEKNKAKSLEPKLNPKPDTKNIPTLVDPSGKPIKPKTETKDSPTLVDPSGKPIKPKTELETKPKPKDDCTKKLPLTLEIRNKFRDSVAEAYGDNPEVQKYVNAITLFGRDSINFDSGKEFNDLDVTMGINTKYEREQLADAARLKEINNARKAIQEMWTDADKRFMSKTGVPLECASIFVYDEYGGRPFNAPDKTEGYELPGSIRVMLKTEKFSLIPLHVDVTGKAHAGKTITSTPIGNYDINDVKQYAHESINKIGNETKQGKPMNPKYIVKVTDALEKLIKKLPQYLKNEYNSLVEIMQKGDKIEKSRAIDYLTKIDKLDPKEFAN